MRYRALFVYGLLGSGHNEHASVAPSAHFEVGIGGIGHAQTAVDREAVGVEAGRQRPDCGAPNALFVFLKRHRLLRKFENARRAHENHFRRLRREEADGNGPIGVNLG